MKYICTENDVLTQKYQRKIEKFPDSVRIEKSFVHNFKENIIRMSVTMIEITTEMGSKPEKNLLKVVF